MTCAMTCGTQTLMLKKKKKICCFHLLTSHDHVDVRRCKFAHLTLVEHQYPNKCKRCSPNSHTQCHIAGDGGPEVKSGFL